MSKVPDIKESVVRKGILEAIFELASEEIPKTVAQINAPSENSSDSATVEDANARLSENLKTLIPDSLAGKEGNTQLSKQLKTLLAAPDRRDLFRNLNTLSEKAKEIMEGNGLADLLTFDENAGREYDLAFFAKAVTAKVISYSETQYLASQNEKEDDGQEVKERTEKQQTSDAFRTLARMHKSFVEATVGKDGSRLERTGKGTAIKTLPRDEQRLPDSLPWEEFSHRPRFDPVFEDELAQEILQGTEEIDQDQGEPKMTNQPKSEGGTPTPKPAAEAAAQPAPAAPLKIDPATVPEDGPTPKPFAEPTPAPATPAPTVERITPKEGVEEDGAQKHAFNLRGLQNPSAAAPAAPAEQAEETPEPELVLKPTNDDELFATIQTDKPSYIYVYTDKFGGDKLEVLEEFAKQRPEIQVVAVQRADLSAELKNELKIHRAPISIAYDRGRFSDVENEKTKEVTNAGEIENVANKQLGELGVELSSPFEKVADPEPTNEEKAADQAPEPIKTSEAEPEEEVAEPAPEQVKEVAPVSNLHISLLMAREKISQLPTIVRGVFAPKTREEVAEEEKPTSRWSRFTEGLSNLRNTIRERGLYETYPIEGSAEQATEEEQAKHPIEEVVSEEEQKAVQSDHASSREGLGLNADKGKIGEGNKRKERPPLLDRLGDWIAVRKEGRLAIKAADAHTKAQEAEYIAEQEAKAAEETAPEAGSEAPKKAEKLVIDAEEVDPAEKSKGRKLSTPLKVAGFLTLTGLGVFFGQRDKAPDTGAERQPPAKAGAPVPGESDSTASKGADDKAANADKGEPKGAGTKPAEPNQDNVLPFESKKNNVGKTYEIANNKITSDGKDVTVEQYLGAVQSELKTNGYESADKMHDMLVLAVKDGSIKLTPEQTELTLKVLDELEAEKGKEQGAVKQ